MDYYKAPLAEMTFLLKAFQYPERVQSLEAFEMFDIETLQALLETTSSIASKELIPLNRIGDEEGIHWDPETGDVTTPEGFQKAYQTMVENGLFGVTGPAEYGGMGGPEILGIFFSEVATAANKSFSMCPGLTRGLVDALRAHGSDEQKDFYLPKLISGEWSGTMCLTEPQCGTDLGLVRTKAIPQDDGSYKLTGTKIWITFGEHDLADNIIHLVLARLPDAPPGIKGISTFIVPKMIDGERNAISCTGLEHKMGIKASPTCVMDMENATGYLVGTPNKGMRTMFVMMNAARLHVGCEGIALGEIAYQTALAFAKDRRQSRSLDAEKQDANAEADNILVHPDVRRMLLNVKTTTMALRALATYIAVEYDVAHHHEDEEVRQQADDLVALLTPIIKSYGSERGFLNISEAMQVCGGAGYTTDWNIEQYLRDERIAMIYEGTNHIQALDLVGRKLPMKNGRLMQNFSARVTELIRGCKDNEALEPFVTPLKDASKKLTAVTWELAAKGAEDREVVGAVASNYLNLFALTTLAFVWTMQAKYIVENEVADGETRLKLGRYFMDKVLPEVDFLVAAIGSGKSNIMEFDVEEF
ncbi:MAG: acyl-CoA dehydrogenase C-terminal domain-containing protein [Myxococcota bacterium]|jgi:alkylation response protein AidB-like acyl-CoA dehydrogenase|nr:acyl-CoA dehydrogenase C-terminal domain-containing protein [Myxococcota bacterium]